MHTISASRNLRQLERDLDQRARDYLVAVADTRQTSHQPSPVRAACVGLLPAWNAWVDVLARRDGEDYREHRIQPDGANTLLKIGEAGGDLFIEAVRINNPAFHARMTKGEMKRPIILAAAALLYQTRQHAVIEPTPALQTWLTQTDIGEDIPATLFQLPHPAVFLRFGPEMANAVDSTLWATPGLPATTQGVYIFESWLGPKRELTFLAVGLSPNNPQEQAHLITLIFTDEGESIIDHVHNLDRKYLAESDAAAMVQTCIKVMLYMQTAGAVRIDEMRQHEVLARMDRVGGKKVSKVQRQLATRYNRIVVGPKEVIHYTSGEVAPHWRRGHMRMQAHGPQSALRKLIFIAPTLIRADKLAEATPTSA